MSFKTSGKFMVESADDRCEATKTEGGEELRCFGEAGHDGNHTWKAPEK
jgi:hypothetical protein